MLCGLKWRTCICPWFSYDTVEADRLAHMNVPGDPAPHPLLFPIPARANPANPPIPFDAFFPPPPPRPNQAPIPVPRMPNPPVDNVFDAFGHAMNHERNGHFAPDLQVGRQAAAWQLQEFQRQRDHHQQLLRQQHQLEERQRRLRADEELAREMARADLGTQENDALAVSRRRREDSDTSSEAPRSVQAGLGGPGRRRGSDRVDGWMEFVEPEVRAVPVR